MAYRRFRLARLFSIILLTSVFAACGGSGGGSAPAGGGPVANPPPPPPPPPPPAKVISGNVMLGPVASAIVEIRGTVDVLGTGTTRADGSFGPIEYTGSYDGPLRITVTGDSSSTWVCDFAQGCPADGSGVAFGETDVYDGTLEAVVSDATDGQVVQVSMLSNFVAKRMDRIGELSAPNVDQANLDVAGSLRQMLGPILDQLGVELGDNVASVALLDISNLPEPDGVAEDRLKLVLSLINSGLMGSMTGDQPVGEFIEQFSTSFAADPLLLPVSSPARTEPSQGLIIGLVLNQINAIRFNGLPQTDEINALLAPIANIDSLANVTADTILSLPRLILERDSVAFFVDDLTLQGGPLVADYSLTATQGREIREGEYGLRILSIEGGDWVTPFTSTIDGEPHVSLNFDLRFIEGMNNGTYDALLEAYSTTGELLGRGLRVELRVAVTGPQVDAGPDIAADERSSVMLSGFTNLPDNVQSIDWVQLAGPALVVEDVLQPTVQLPAVDTDETATLRLDVDFVTGESLSDTVNINIVAALNIADVVIPDTALQQCVTDAAVAGNLVEAAELTSLSCAGISDLTGLSDFINLAVLDLSGGSFGSLSPLIGMSSTTFLDISGNPGFQCDQVDALADRLVEGVDLLVDDTCRATFELELAANGFDAAHDPSREQLYISLPDRNEIAVISTTELRIIDRISVPGSPYGIDISVDGTRLFAALNGSNAVAAIDLDQRAVSTIDLGDSTGHSLTYDVVEAEQDRLFVTASPSSGGFAYVAQIELSPALIASRVANQRIIRARPTLAVAPDRQFVYVGEGFSPNSIYKLSLQDPDAGIVLEDDHGSVGGTDNLVLNSTGTRIAIRSGQVLRTGSFIEEGRVTAGPSATDGTTLFVLNRSGVVEGFDFATLEPTQTIETGCSVGFASRLTAFDGGQSFMALEQDIACIPGPVSRSGGPPDPLAALRLPDLALEECVISAAENLGVTTPEEFSALDCSGAARTILDLQGIEQFSNLTSLNISNSSVSDLSPIKSLDLLEAFVADDAGVTDIGALFSINGLVSADLTDNPAILCADFDQLVATGTALTANACTDTERVELGGIGHDLEYDSANSRVFVSVPSLNRVSEIDLNTASISTNFALAAQPRGIDFSSDGVTLYAALNGTGQAVAINTMTADTSVMHLLSLLNDSRTWDIAEVSPERIVVSANPGSNGTSYIVEVRRDLSDTSRRIADQRIIRAAPIFAVSADQTSVYVGEGFSPNSVYRLDATIPTFSIVAEDNHGDVSGSSSLALSPDGSRLYLLSGQVLSTDTITQVGKFPSGRSTVSGDGTKLFVGDVDDDAAREYDTTTTGQTGSRAWGCDLQSLSSLVEFGDGIIAMGDDLVCFSRTVPYP